MPVPAQKTATYMDELCDWTRPIPRMRIEWILADCKRSLRSAGSMSNQEISVCYNAIGQAHVRLAMFRQALDDFRNAEHYAPDNNDVKICIAAAMLNLNMSAEALATLANTSEPDALQQTFILCNAAEALADLGAMSDARDVFAEAVRTADHSNYRILHLLATQAAEIGADREAIEFLARSEAIRRGVAIASQPALEFIEQSPDIWDSLKQPVTAALYGAVMRAKMLGSVITTMKPLDMQPLERGEADAAAKDAMEVYDELTPLRLASNEAVMKDNRDAS